MIRTPPARSIAIRIVAASAVAASASILGGGCSTIGGQATVARSLLPTRSQAHAGPFLISTHEPLGADDPAIHQLLALERRVGASLGVRVDPDSPPIEVYVLDDRSAFDHFLRIYYPELPSRRAFFLALDSRRVVYTYRNPSLEVDLRHEGTHAILSASGLEIPLWLDEGLAEYFEVPEEAGGRNADHLAKLPDDLAGGWSPDMARLERLRDSRQMTARDYRESWAWVHYLLDGDPRGRDQLLGYLADLRREPDPAPLSRRLDGRMATPRATLAAHLDRLKSPPRVTARLQGPEPEGPTPSGPPARGPLGRLLDRLRD